MKNLLFVFVFIAGLTSAGIDYATADTTVIQPDAAAGKDAWLNPSAGGTNYGTDTKLAVGAGALTGGTQARTLIQFDLSGIPSGSTIDSATLSLYCFGDNLNFGGGAGSGAAAVSVHKVTSAWDETTITNNSAPSFESTATATTTVNAKNSWFSWDITNLVQAWFGGTATSYGMLLKTAQGAPSTWAFYSSDYIAEATLSPKLTVTYTAGGGGNTPPTAVTLNNPTNVTNDSITLSWTQNNDPDFASYKIYRSISAGVDETSTLVTTITSQTTTSYTDTGLTAGTTYYYKVYVTDTGGLSSGSNEISQTTGEIEIEVWAEGVFMNFTTGELEYSRIDAVDPGVEPAEYKGAIPDETYYMHVKVTDTGGRLNRVEVRKADTNQLIATFKVPEDGDPNQIHGVVPLFYYDFVHGQFHFPVYDAASQILQDLSKIVELGEPRPCYLVRKEGYPKGSIPPYGTEQPILLHEEDLGPNCDQDLYWGPADFAYRNVITSFPPIDPKYGDLNLCGHEPVNEEIQRLHFDEMRIARKDDPCYYHHIVRVVKDWTDDLLECKRKWIKTIPGVGDITLYEKKIGELGIHYEMVGLRPVERKDECPRQPPGGGGGGGGAWLERIAPAVVAFMGKDGASHAKSLDTLFIKPIMDFAKLVVASWARLWAIQGFGSVPEPKVSGTQESRQVPHSTGINEQKNNQLDLSKSKEVRTRGTSGQPVNCRRILHHPRR